MPEPWSSWLPGHPAQPSLAQPSPQREEEPGAALPACLLLIGLAPFSLLGIGSTTPQAPIVTTVGLGVSLPPQAPTNV